MVRLFETRKKEGSAWWWLYACSVLLGLLLIWVYRTSNVPESGDRGRWAWVAVFASELWFGFEWLLTLSTRWNPIYRYTFKDRLTERFDDKLPGVDVFICTADPTLEPPKVVINTVLSVLAYDYPPEKLSVYLSDDGGSIFTFYALLEAMRFARLWIPFCKKFNVQPMSPALFFSKSSIPEHDPSFSELAAIKKLYKDMENRIDLVLKHGNISEEIWEEHEGFSEWSSRTTFNDHQAIIKILIDERDKNAHDNEGFPMPRFVYMAREKRPKYHHNFKAGALNALLRVSEQISNGPIILTIDCDMCANSAEAIKDALCFFMDEERGHEYAYVQFFQSFVNITRHDLYASSYNVVQKVYYPGLDGQGGPGYSGSCCFHKRECLNGKKFREPSEIVLTRDALKLQEASTRSLEDTTKKLAACSSEDNTQWGKEMGVKYGCPLEDIITGFSIQCKGWKSAYFIPEREAFLGLAPTTLSQALIQNQRWTEGYLQILLSKYCPFVYGIGRTKLGLQVGYSICCFWAFSSVPSLIYAVIPSICFLNGISLFPTVSNFWFMPFAFVIAVTNLVSLRESLYHGETFKHWWNDCRMSLYRRTTSYLFALLNTVLTLLNITDSAFVITPKLEDEEASKRYEQEIMEFGSSSPMFTLLSTVATLNLFCLVGGVAKAISYDGFGRFGSVFLQFLLCGSLVLINFPVYQASFFRNDRGCIPMKTTIFSVAVVIVFLAIPVW